MGRVPAPSADDSRAVQALLIVLSVTAGCTDIIGFLVLNGLFTAHITGNLVILAAHIVGGGEAEIAPMLSVPVFIVMVGLTRLLAGGLASLGLASLRPLLLLQFLLLAGFLVLCVAAGQRIDPNATNAILAGMLGVSAMAVQNALVQISLKGGTVHGGDDEATSPASRWMSAGCFSGAIRPMWPRRATGRRVLCR